MTNWNPNMEEAPRDGTPVLLWRPDALGGPLDMASWDDDRFAKAPKPFWRSQRIAMSKSTSRRYVPTFWAPITPPES